ncbi:iron dicitrate transport regulator FecR [Bradyrhizobium sp. CCBAU 11434]|uniref:FecR domain-containing protein n=1 Tax=Bradyrhizobium zhengyangense TaxID=2911009 RepID=A0ABS9LNT4_9BRAD|nr:MULTISPECIES: FecR domain-containing protein [Bradyrhizobium]MCG2668561.1 FecR domain-containing protein [Bradyrhizobium zhengyangense]MDA9524356.1 iron dicitrate transport regulator FecR [Bradyrhizobium sp. CCBAU 11434]
MVAWRRFVFALPLLALPLAGADNARASDAIELAQAQPQVQSSPAPSPTPAASPAPAADAQSTTVEPIGNVATVTGIATVIRDKNSYPLKVRDDIYLNDVVQTSSNSSLGITFNDATTFNLSASAKITIDNYVYEDGGKQNSAIFDIGKGTVAFVAAAVAKTGDMKIATPTATLGIRGTTGVVDVPENATANAANNVNIKLYPDADGRVGHIDVNDRASGTRLGALTQASSGFAIRPGAAGPGGMRFAAVPITIPPQQIARDRGFVSQVHAAQTTGRQIVTEQRDFRRANPAAVSRIPRPAQVPQQQQLRPNPAPTPQQPQRPNGQPGQPGQNNRPGQQPQPGAPNRQGTQPGTQQPQRQGQGGATQLGAPRAGQGQQQPGQPGTGQPAGQPRTGQGTQPSGALQTPTQRSRQSPQRPGPVTPAQPNGTTPQTPHTGLQPGQPGAPPTVQPQQGAAPRQPGFQQRLPGAQRPAAPRRPALAPPPKEKKKR